MCATSETEDVEALKAEYVKILDDSQFEPTITEIWKRNSGLMRRLRVLAREWIKDVHRQYSRRRFERHPRRPRGSVDWSKRDATAMAALPLAVARLAARYPVVRIAGVSLRREAGVRYWSPREMPLSGAYIKGVSESTEAFYERSVVLCAEHISSTGGTVTRKGLLELAGTYPMAYISRNREKLLDKLCEQAIWDTSTHILPHANSGATWRCKKSRTKRQKTSCRRRRAPRDRSGLSRMVRCTESASRSLRGNSHLIAVSGWSRVHWANKGKRLILGAMCCPGKGASASSRR
jgi:hypothetical protein